MSTPFSSTSDAMEKLTFLKSLTQQTTAEGSRTNLAEEHWLFLERTVTKLTGPSLAPEEQAILSETFRILRNACAHCSENQHKILSSSLFEQSVIVIKHLISEWPPQESVTSVVPLRCGLQFLGNLTVGNHVAKGRVWSAFLQREDGIFGKLLTSSDFKVCEYSSMLFYTCLLSADITCLYRTREGIKLLDALAQLFATEKSCEWNLYALEAVIENEEALVASYLELLPLSRFVILDIITEMLESSKGNSPCRLPKTSLKYLSGCFKNFVLDIVKTHSASENDDHQPIEIKKLLSVLCAASVISEYAVVLLEDDSILEACVDTLKTIHLLGKTGENAFTSVQQLTLLDRAKEEEIQSHPAFGFKRDLVRIIGNLASHSSSAQNVVRTLDGISLLLDCCSLDARNPFIMQWCILALRNLMKDNRENQLVLASMAQNGILVESTLLRELGLCAETIDNRVVIKPISLESVSTDNSK